MILFRENMKRICVGLLLLVFLFTSFFVPQTTVLADNHDTQTITIDPYYNGPSFDELFEKYSKQCAKAQVVALVVDLVASYLASGFQVPTVDWGEKIKELIGDCFISATKNALLEIITGQAVGFAQRGYGGNPSFVQNMDQYLLNIADNAAGDFISKAVGGDFLCSPFRAEVQLALTRHYQAQSGRLFPYGQSSCTLTEIASNVDAFLEGDFYAGGGWAGWIELVGNPYNTPYGAYLRTSQQLDEELETDEERTQVELGFASGFLSKTTQTCYLIASDGSKTAINADDLETAVQNNSGAQYECDKPQTTTPGDTIKTSMEKAFGVKLDTIVEADEINEIIDLVAVYLMTDIMRNSSGLAGYDYNAEFERPLVNTGWNDYLATGGGSNGDGGGSGGGGGWQCKLDLDAWEPASRTVTWTLDSYTGDGSGGGFDNPRKIQGVEIEKYYEKAEFDFDLYLTNIPGNARGQFDDILSFARDKITGDFGGYWSIGIKQNNGDPNETYMDIHGGEFEHARTDWDENKQYHVNIVQDARQRRVFIKVTKEGQQIADISFRHDGSDIIATDSKGLFVYLSSREGWKYENLKVTLTPGGPHDGGARVRCGLYPDKEVPPDAPQQ